MANNAALAILTGGLIVIAAYFTYQDVVKPSLNSAAAGQGGSSSVQGSSQGQDLQLAPSGSTSSAPSGSIAPVAASSTSTQHTSTGQGTVTDVSNVPIIDLSGIQGAFPGQQVVLNPNTGLISSASGTPLNLFQNNSGQSSSSNTATTPGQAGTVGTNGIGLSSSTPVYGLGTTYTKPGEYTSTTGAQEYIGSQAEFDQQQSAGFLK